MASDTWHGKSTRKCSQCTDLHQTAVFTALSEQQQYQRTNERTNQQTCKITIPPGGANKCHRWNNQLILLTFANPGKTSPARCGTGDSCTTMASIYRLRMFRPSLLLVSFTGCQCRVLGIASEKDEPTTAAAAAGCVRLINIIQRPVDHALIAPGTRRTDSRPKTVAATPAAKSGNCAKISRF